MPLADRVGASWRGRSVGRMAGQWAGCRRQAGNGRARNRARALLNWFSQGQRWGRCKVRRRAERVSRPVREKKRRRRVLVVTTCSPRPMRAVQRARLWAITCTASQAALAAKRQGCGIGVPWAAWRIPAWADSHNDPLREPRWVLTKAEHAEKMDAQIGVRRCVVASPSDDGGQLSRILWLDLPRDLVRPKFSNI